MRYLRLNGVRDSGLNILTRREHTGCADISCPEQESGVQTGLSEAVLLLILAGLSCVYNQLRVDKLSTG